ncbi:MAG: hypothetical protein ACYTGB_15845 [Planctomycetota bacterium]|jgi:ssDNA-binding Zn-finger/Zn-ribbon topoisomerase 1
MAFRCPHCGAEMDATLFEFGRRAVCSCGRRVEAGHVLHLEEPREKPEPPEEGAERSPK